jgi:hypothetical protein
MAELHTYTECQDRTLEYCCFLNKCVIEQRDISLLHNQHYILRQVTSNYAFVTSCNVLFWLNNQHKSYM